MSGPADERLRVAEHALDTPRGTVHATAWTHTGGGAAGAPILLFHESLGCVAAWGSFPARLALATGRGVVAWDRIGYGRSTPRQALPGPGFVEDEAAFAIGTVVPALGLGRVVVFGHSTGGSMALLAAAHRPAECEAAVAVSAQAFVEARTVAGVRAARDAFAVDPARFARLQRLHGPRARWVLDAWTETWLAPWFAGWRLVDALPAVRCPVLALHGRSDPFGSEAHPEAIVAHVGGPARCVLLPGCGHVPHREREAEVLQAVAGLLQRRPPR
ncbi:alpha/beta hydrolase [Luteimonas sp. FCS-9]|uniref:alpha/beta fold hydrolase n=1 Tax=Luteimonas sp. FCS-9 TaxID=1547516 RepID=UPI00063EB687|nr:alpha/beta hydrolase [Luteimonas sp. FCS-9]KLJ01140.1 hypothetical protein WQ56_07385 [Luteimonas sp. FCS-9]